MHGLSSGLCVQVYLGDTDKVGHGSSYLAILQYLRREGAAGATVTRGTAGFGARSVVKTAAILTMSLDLPIVITWVDAPVSGGQVGAEAGDLTIMAGGTDAAFQRALPILQTVGKRITHLGPAGSGQVTKLANQLIVAQTIDAVAQALRLAELAGADSAKVREALLGGFAESRILNLHGDRMVRRDFEPGGRSALQLKDVRLICELAESLGFHSPTLDNCRAQWEKFVHEEGHGEVDHSGLFLLYDKR